MSYHNGTYLNSIMNFSLKEVYLILCIQQIRSILRLTLKSYRFLCEFRANQRSIRLASEILEGPLISHFLPSALEPLEFSRRKPKSIQKLISERTQSVGLKLAHVNRRFAKLYVRVV